VLEVVEWIVFIIGLILVTIGAICDLAGALGLVRFPNFFVRLHAATVGTIGGAVIPLFGVALISAVSSQLGPFRWAVAGGAIIAAFLIMIIAPAGSHALAYAAHKAKIVPVEPKVCDLLEEHEKRKAKEAEKK